MGFIKVTKANKTKDRGIIAVDAICAAFEDKDAGTTSIMTMDGFWYEVENDIEQVVQKIVGAKPIYIPAEPIIEPKTISPDSGVVNGTNKFTKRDYYLKKRMPTPPMNDKGGESPIIREKPHEKLKQGFSFGKNGKGKKVRHSISKDLLSGESKKQNPLGSEGAEMPTVGG